MPDNIAKPYTASNQNPAKKKIILVICNYYLPGFKSGGSMRTIVNMIDRLKNKFDFRIVTFGHDRDLVPYKTVKMDEWNDQNGIQVFYLGEKSVNFSKLRELILKVKPDSIYLNSVFSTLSLIVLTLRKIKLIPKLKVILAPEGELSQGALQLKARKKKIFLNFVKPIGLYQNIIWKTTSELEKKDAQRISGKGGKIFVAPNLPALDSFADYNQNKKPKKEQGQVYIVFLSRLMETKNINWLLKNLSGVKGELKIDIFGPIEDENYWYETKKLIESLPENIKVEYKGALLHEQVTEKLFEYHFFLLPTLGENFGHVFVEALSAGCPLIISNRTPWLNLADKEIGWDLPLEEPEKWVEVINDCINYDQKKYAHISSKARSFAKEWLSDPKVEEDTLNVINYGLNDY